MEVCSLTVKELLNLTQEDIMRMKAPDIQKALNTVGKTMNRRITRLTNAGQTTAPAYSSMMRSGGIIGTNSNMDIHSLRSELRRAKNFASLKTSTVTGARKARKDLERRLGGSIKDVSESTLNDMWEAFNRLKETHGTFIRDYGSAKIVQMLFGWMNEGFDMEEMYAGGVSAINEAYEGMYADDDENEFFVIE